ALNGNAYLMVQLKGDGANTQGIGAKLYVAAGGRTQLLEQMPTRGFESSVDPRLHVGLGRAARVDSLTVVWPDRRYQVLRDVAVNRAITLSQRDASGTWQYHRASSMPTFADVTDRVSPDFVHAENSFYDFDREPL